MVKDPPPPTGPLHPLAPFIPLPPSSPAPGILRGAKCCFRSCFVPTRGIEVLQFGHRRINQEWLNLVFHLKHLRTILLSAERIESIFP